MRRASSGSRSSIKSIEPLISANSAVTVLRSPSGGAPAFSATRRRGAFCDGAGGVRVEVEVAGAATASEAAHSLQNFAAEGLANPQLAHRRGNGAGDSLQNFTPSGFSKPQLEQRII